MRILTLFLVKEVREIRRNTAILPIYILLPLIMVGVAVGFTFFVPVMLQAARAQQDPGTLAMLRAAQALPDFRGLPEVEALTRYVLRTMLGLFLLLPTVGASTTAAFSIVGEKQQRTLEPILATPISDRELLLGKLLGALVPPVVAAWAAALVALAGVDLIGWRRFGAVLWPDRFFLLGVLVLGPLMGACATLLTIRLSAKLTDAQAANQVAGLLIVPVSLLVLAIFGRALVASFTAGLVGCAVALGAALYLLQVNVARFRREEILTRWK